MSKTIPFEYAFHNYWVYPEKNQDILVIQWTFNEKYSKYIIKQGSISQEEHLFDTNPMTEESNHYWQDYVDLGSAQLIYNLVKKYDFSLIKSNLTYFKNYIKCEDVSYYDFSMDHANLISDALDSLKNYYYQTHDETIMSIYNQFDEVCDKHFFSGIGISEKSPVWDLSAKEEIDNQLNKIIQFFESNSAQ